MMTFELSLISLSFFFLFLPFSVLFFFLFFVNEKKDRKKGRKRTEKGRKRTEKGRKRTEKGQKKGQKDISLKKKKV